MLTPSMLGALILSGVAGLGMIANEASHGQVAETMGLGHHHMADYGGYHCAAHDGAFGADHLQHMHNGTSMDHDGCPGGTRMHSMGG